MRIVFDFHVMSAGKWFFRAVKGEILRSSAPSDTIQDSTNWHVGADGDTCADIADWNFITLE